MNPLNYLKHTIMNIEMSCKSACMHTRDKMPRSTLRLCRLFSRSPNKDGEGNKKNNHQHQWARKNDSFALHAHVSPQNCHRIVYIQIYTSSGIFRVKYPKKKSFLDDFKIDGPIFCVSAAY